MISFEHIIQAHKYEMENGLYLFRRSGHPGTCIMVGSGELDSCPYCDSDMLTRERWRPEMSTSGWLWNVYACGVMVARLNNYIMLGTSRPTEACKTISKALE